MTPSAGVARLPGGPHGHQQPSFNVKEKLVSLPDAIHAHISDGDCVVLGACLEAAIPFAATYEIVRQGKRDLDVAAPISDTSTDMLIGAGCVRQVTGAWVGNVSSGLGHNFRRAVEQGQPHALKVRDHSNLSFGMALLAAAYGMPYAPVRTLLGSDILASNPDFRQAENPFSRDKEKTVLVPPLAPDATILCVQRADVFGNCHFWGSSGVAAEAALAAKSVVLLADEIVPPEVISSDPSRVLVPGYRVSAVCHVPAACHPAPMTGLWQRDNAFFDDYHKRTRDRDGFLAWLDEWVLGLPDQEAYRKKLGTTLDGLRIKGEALSAPVNYAAH